MPPHLMCFLSKLITFLCWYGAIFGFYLFIYFSCITSIKKSEILYIIYIMLSFLNFSFPHSNILSSANVCFK